MTKLHHHPWHLVTARPWPLLISFNIFNNLIIIIIWVYKINLTIAHLLSIPSTFFCLYAWWRDVTRESSFSGSHTIYVYKSMCIGIIIFIISEVFFFTSFFWTFFHSSLAPVVEIGQLWPPKGIYPFNPFNIPLLNTIILISSGLTITWSHHRILINNFSERIKSLKITIILGIYFSYTQFNEYYESPFTIADSIYGSIFFLATGFHGLHVLIGSIFLIIIFYRIKDLQFSKTHHFGFIAAAWYWHFVDIVWLFLYTTIYWWRF